MLEIGYAYPSSTIADYHNQPNGCAYISDDRLGYDGYKADSTVVFDTVKEALVYAIENNLDISEESLIWAFRTCFRSMRQ